MIIGKFIKFFKKRPVLASVIEGVLLGYFFVSPVMMLISDYAHSFQTKEENIAMLKNPLLHITEVFKLDFLSWALIYVFFTAISLGLLRYVFEKKKKQILESKERSESANRAKSAFLANMSHEIRTPLNGIVGMVQILEQTELNVDQVEYLKHIISCSDSLLTLIGDILMLSKIEVGKHELSTADFDWVRSIEAIIKIFMVNAKKDKTEFISSIQYNLPHYVHGDELKIKEIIMNLLGNAIKFARGKKVEINISGELKGDELKILYTVKDTGIGMSMEQQNKVFKAFEQAEVETSKSFGGTGLGLAICRELAGIIGGKVWVESELGTGATFYFEISLPISSKVIKVESKKKEYHIDINANILLVEDNEMNIIVAETLLKKMGLKTDIARDGLEAVKKRDVNRYDLILMDVQMKGMDGIEATRIIREKELTEKIHTPIIALTAYVMEEDVKSCLDSGMDDYLSKPIKVSELKEMLLKYIPRN